MIVIMSLLACGIAGASKAITVSQITQSPKKVSETPTRTKPLAHSAVIKSGNSESLNTDHSKWISFSSSPASAIGLECAVAAASGSGLSGRFSIFHKLGKSDASLPSQIANDAGLELGAPLLITEEDSTRAIALESATCKAEPFTSTALFQWDSAADRQTRISLFAMNIGPAFGDPDAFSVAVDAEDFAQNHYPLLVEHVSEVPGYPGLNMVVVRLDENLGSVGDVLISIRAHGKTSNRGRVGIGFVGAGLPDNSTPAPMGTDSSTTLALPQTLPTITGFELHDAGNNVYQLSNGTQLAMGSMPEPLQIYALTGTTPVGSVRVKLATVDDHIDNNTPYDTNQFTLSQLRVGTSQMMATAYTKPNGKGMQGTTLPD